MNQFRVRAEEAADCSCGWVEVSLDGLSLVHNLSSRAVGLVVEGLVSPHVEGSDGIDVAFQRECCSATTELGSDVVNCEM